MAFDAQMSSRAGRSAAESSLQQAPDSSGASQPSISQQTDQQRPLTILITGALLLALSGLFITIGGIGSLQRSLSKQNLTPIQNAILVDAFQSAGQVPYTNEPSRQLAQQWWTVSVETFFILCTLLAVSFPDALLRWRLVAIPFLVYGLVLLSDQIKSVLFFRRLPTEILGHNSSPKLEVVFAGLIIAAVGTCLSIIFLGLLRDAVPSPPLPSERESE